MSDHDGITVDDLEPCFICGKPCSRIDRYFEGRLHFHPCRAQAWSMHALEMSGRNP